MFPMYSWLLLVFLLYGPSLLFSLELPPLLSTESDPDAFVQNCVQVMSGDYCESATDFTIQGPDALVLQRFYSTQDAVVGREPGKWRLLPQRFLIVGNAPSGKTTILGKNRFTWTTAWTGERSGAIHPYSGWKSQEGWTQEPLQIDLFNEAVGLVNTYAKEIRGQNNHKNNRLHCKGDRCQLYLGDGTERIYRKVRFLPKEILGEELTPIMAAQVVDPTYFLLEQEKLPSGNALFFSYDAAHHLVAIEMKTPVGKLLSWIRFSYLLTKKRSLVTLTTSDHRELTYEFVDNQLTQVSGSHAITIEYAYQNQLLVKKQWPEGRFIEIDYQDGKVRALKGPNATSGLGESVYTFSYGAGYTDLFDAMGVKTRYLYDKRFQLTAIEKYDEGGRLYRTEQKFWGQTPSDIGLLLAKTVGDGTGRIYSYRGLQYDPSGNVLQERLYGNLTGKREVSLQVSLDGKILNTEEEECHTKSFGYSTEGHNLLTKLGDCKGNQTVYSYQPGTNLLTKKWIYDRGLIKKRTFQKYNEDGVCIQTIEDDGCYEDVEKISCASITERHIQEILPKMTLPGVGLPEVVLEKVLDLKTKKEILIKKLVHTYDAQANVLSCKTYDANGEYAFTEKRTYTHLGKVASETDALGREVFYTYDALGNEILRWIPTEKRSIRTIYDFSHRPTLMREETPERSVDQQHRYDLLGRKIATTDGFGQTTYYEYDAFHRLTKVLYPEVLDDNGQPSRPTFSYTYDLFGYVVESIDPKGFVTKKRYNLRGDPTRVEYPDGSYEIFKYDPEGSLHRSLTRDKIITVYEYDYLGRPVYEESSTAGETGISAFFKSKSYQYNGFHCTYEKEDDQITRYFFDPAGRLATVARHGFAHNEKSPEARVTEYKYDAFGRIKQSKVWFDVGEKDYALECYSYDLAGHIIEKRIEDAEHVPLLQRYYTYTPQGQCEEEYILENGEKKSLNKTLYNMQGEPICYIDGLGEKTDILLERHQNALGQDVLKKTLIDPLGTQTEMEFDALGRVVSLCKRDRTDLMLSSQKNQYDLVGNQSAEIHEQILNGQVLSKQKIERIYGPMGRLEEESHGSDAPIRYTYNTLGKLVYKEKAGVVVTYTYNKDGNLHKIESSSNQKELQVSNSYSYDRKGNITSAYALHGKSIQRTYSCLNQIIRETIKDGEGTYNLAYSYDRKGRLKSITLPDQSKITYTYDALFGRAVRRFSPTGELLYTHTYDTYDLQGQLLLENHIGYTGHHSYTYDRKGQKIASHSDFSQEEILRDALGRITTIKGKKTEQYFYNSLSQLISEEKNSYSYDSLDNRLEANNTALLYNSLNQLLSYATTEFSYDSQGNLLRKILDGEETRFTSNALSQLINIEKPDQTALSFSYDPLGRLLVEKHLDVKGKNKKNLSTRRYLYLGYQEIGSLSTTGAVECLKVPGISGAEISSKSIALEIGGNLYVPIHDQRGNVIQLIDPYSREVIESYDYTAFGETHIFDGEGKERKTALNPWQFAEKRYDDVSGFILFGLRFYDPCSGRWISQDPVGELDGPNLCAYLHNNPLNHFDRLGLATESDSPNQLEEYMYGEVESHCYCEKHRTCKRGGDIGSTATKKASPLLYFDSFERLCGDDEGSKTYDLGVDGRPDLPNGLGIGFINGVWNRYEDAKESVEYISRFSGGYNIHAVYNATHGALDLPECGLGLMGIATEPVRQLHKMWNSFFEKSNQQVKFLMICHSQGAIHVRNALLDYSPELRKRILVVAVAPAAYIYLMLCAQVVHYRAAWWRDGIPRGDVLGALLAASTIVTLASHREAPLFDHPFMSPTYEEHLERHIKNYIRSKGRIF